MPGTQTILEGGMVTDGRPIHQVAGGGRAIVSSGTGKLAVLDQKLPVVGLMKFPGKLPVEKCCPIHHQETCVWVGAPVELTGVLSAQVPLQFASGELHLLSCTPAQYHRSKKAAKPAGTRSGGVNQNNKTSPLASVSPAPLLTQVNIVRVGKGEIF